MPYQQANELLQKCDIFLDQFVLGAHGVAAIEAIAYGKPVLCYIKPSQINLYPPDLPIVNANVEKYHDATILSRELLTLYESL